MAPAPTAPRSKRFSQNGPFVDFPHQFNYRSTAHLLPNSCPHVQVDPWDKDLSAGLDESREVSQALPCSCGLHVAENRVPFGDDVRSTSCALVRKPVCVKKPCALRMSSTHALAGL
jgi:hypothetical protein